jgi:hypothetical protein
VRIVHLERLALYLASPESKGGLMKSIIIGGVVVVAVALLAPTIVQAQGTTYLSNLGQLSIGSHAVASDSWLAADFFTGNNADGYMLNSVQLGMTDASGNPNGFTIMIYANSNPDTILPGSSLGTLSGSADPVTAGTYTYAPVSNLTLSPNADYFIVLTAETAVANGAYDWSRTDTDSYNPNGGWSGERGIFFTSSNGLNWNLSSPYAQYAINATPIPEPSSLSLLGALALPAFLFFRRTKNECA